MKRENGKHIACSARPAARPLRVQLFTSVLAVVMCCALLCASTFAWFTANATATVSEIKAAEFGMTINVNSTAVILTNTDGFLTGSYTFESATSSATLTITGEGSGGFCVISGPTSVTGNEGDVIGTYYTRKISPGEESGITLTIGAGANTTIEFYCVWGDPTTFNNDISLLSMDGNTSESEEMRLYGDGDTILFAGAPEDDTPFVWYALVAGITVENLAAYYGVSVDYILEFNHLASLADVGNDIKVPNPNGINLPFIPDTNDEDETDEDKTDEDETDEDGETPIDETETPAPTDTPEPSDTPTPDESPEPSDTPAPEETPEPDNSPEPTDTPEPSESPSDTPAPEETPEAEEAPTVEDTPAPVSESESPAEPEPEAQPQADATPVADPELPAEPQAETP